MPRPSKPRRDSKRLTSAGIEVTRVEFSGIVEQLRQHAHNLEIQFRRIADIQADLDELKRRLTGRKSGTRG